MSLVRILDRAPVDSIDDAIAIMKTIDESLPDNDGVKWFNRLYLRVTVSVGTAVGSAKFNDPAFLTKLDVVFANLYFSALATGLTDIGAAPSAWRPLLQARNTAGIARIQFALAGMNTSDPSGEIRSPTNFARRTTKVSTTSWSALKRRSRRNSR